MGYCHSWEVGDIHPFMFELIVSDMKKLIPHLPKLCNVDGVGEPTFSDTLIEFNGDGECNHKEENVYNQGGLDMSTKELEAWYAKRPCHGAGECAHEPFMLGVKKIDWESTKTNRKPYDLAVTACLLIAKKHMGDKILVHSDGNFEDWNPARELCMLHLGYSDVPFDPEDDDYA